MKTYLACIQRPQSFYTPNNYLIETPPNFFFLIIIYEDKIKDIKNKIHGTLVDF